MRSPTRTLTTIGLSLHDEILVKSMVRAVDGLTRHHWDYVDDMDADIAVCGCSSALAAAAKRRAADAARPRFIGLLHDGESSAFDETIAAPLRSRELIALLDSAASDGTSTKREGGRFTAPPQATDSTVDSHASLSPAIASLHQLLVDRGLPPSRWRLKAGTLDILVSLPSRTYVTSTAITDADLRGLLTSSARVELESDQGRPTGAPTPVPCGTLDQLLWRCGNLLDARLLLPLLAGDKRFKLRQWPDFGRLAADRRCIALAAQLSRQFLSAQELSRLHPLSAAEINAFLHASLLCGLLEVRSAAVEAPSPTAHTANGRPAQWGSILRTLRTALGIPA